jgi:hypothetical protein
LQQGCQVRCWLNFIKPFHCIKTAFHLPGNCWSTLSPASQLLVNCLATAGRLSSMLLAQLQRPNQAPLWRCSAGASPC